MAVVGCAIGGEVVAGAAAMTGGPGLLLRRGVPRAFYRSASRSGNAGGECSRQSQYVSRWSAPSPNSLYGASVGASVGVGVGAGVGCGFAFGSVVSSFWLYWFAS